MRISVYLAPCLLACASQQAMAQNDQSKEEIGEQMSEASLDDATRINSNDGPADRSAFGSKSLNIQLNNNEGATSATASFDLGNTTSKSKGKDVDGNRIYKVQRNQFTVKATVPLFETTNSASSPFNFGKLGDFEKVTIGFTGSSSTIKDGSRGDEIIDRAIDSCALKTLDALQDDASVPQDLRQRIPSFLTIYVRESREVSDSRSRKIPPNVLLDIDQDSESGPNSGLSATPYKDIRARLKSKCLDATSDEVFIREFLGEDSSRAYRDAYFTRDPITFYGFDATIGRNELKFIDTAMFSELSDTKTDWEVSAFLGRIDANANWALRGKVSYSETHESNDSMTVCQMPTMMGVDPECLEGPIGAPKKKSSGFVSAEYRQKFNLSVDGKGLQLGIAPQLVYDIDKDIFGIDVPVYLPSSKDGELTGGLRFGYRTDTDDVAVGIFIGVPFQVPF